MSVVSVVFCLCTRACGAESSWRTIASNLKSPAMRKKNLERETSYFFRVKPNTGGNNVLSSARLKAVLSIMKALFIGDEGSINR